MRVLLADDHRLLIEGLGNLLGVNGIQVLGIAGDGFEAVRLAEALHPDLILMDLRMPRCDGLEATRRIKALHPEIKIVILTTSAEDRDLFESIKSGACGYLLKSMSGGEFIDALRGLEQGIPPFSPGLAAKLLNEFARMAKEDTATRARGDTEMGRRGEAETRGRGDSGMGRRGDMETEGELTERQIEVLRLVAGGLSYKEVGARLNLSPRTIKYHMAEIMEQLHLANRAQVLAYAGKMGWTVEGKQ